MSNVVTPWFSKDYYLESPYANPLGPMGPREGPSKVKRGGWFTLETLYLAQVTARASGGIFQHDGTLGALEKHSVEDGLQSLDAGA